MRPLYHIWLFLFGALYYLIVPALVVASRIWESYPGMDNLYSYYKDEYMLGYSVIVFLIIYAFWIGARLPLFYNKERESVFSDRKYINSRGFFLISLPILLYGQYLIMANRGSLFQGYTEGLDVAFVGSLATINMFFLFLFFYNKLGCSSKSMNILLSLILIELSIVVIGLGTRMYVMVTVFSILIYLLDNKVIRFKKMLLYLSAVILFILAVGIWRMGESNVTIEQLIYIGIAEPAFTWISAISMYDMNSLPIVSIPVNYLSSFINFIPSLLLPDKTDMMSDLTLDYYNPLGATSIFLSLISDFGLLGTFFAVFCLGFMLTQIRLHWQSVFGQTYYYCICGMIPFQLFRDDFAIINKGLFSNFLLLPIIIIFIHRIMSLLATRTE